MKTFNMQKL